MNNLFTYYVNFAQSSLNGSGSNLPDSSGRFATSFSGQSGAASPVFHHTGGLLLLDFLVFVLKLVELKVSLCRNYSGIQ